MENLKKEDTLNKKENDIVFTKTLKAGKRIYYLDVKKNKKDEFFLAITESKKIISGEDCNPIVQFEKHKIFLYQEDFDKFTSGLNEVMTYIKDNSPEKDSRRKNRKSLVQSTKEEFSLKIFLWGKNLFNLQISRYKKFYFIRIYSSKKFYLSIFYLYISTSQSQ